MTAVADIRRKASTLLMPPPKIDAVQWIEEHVVLPSDVSDRPGAMVCFPYQREIVRACQDHEFVVMPKAARVGATSIMVALAASYTANDPTDIMFVEPRDEDALDFAVTTVDPVFAASPALAHLIAPDRATKKRDKIKRRQFPGGSMRFCGAAARNTKRIKVNKLFLDEVDSYEPAPGEGDVVQLFIDRTRTAPNRLIFMASTPTDSVTSRIAREYETTDKRIYEIQCGSCAHYFEPRFRDHLRWDKDESGAHLPHTAHLVCPANGCVIEESQKAAAVQAGRWRPTAHAPGRAGFRMSALISTITHASWAQIAREFLDAKDDVEKLQAFTCTVLGEPWEFREGEGIDENALAARAEPFGLKALPTEARLLTGGVDIQDDRLVLVTVAHDATALYVLDYEEIFGPPTSDVVWKELDQLIRRRFAHPLGGTLGYDSVAIDSGSGLHTDLVYRFSKPRMARRVYAIKGVTGSRPIVERSTTTTGLFIVGHEAVKTRLYGLLARPGAVRFSADLPLRYFEELASNRRQTIKRPGGWVKRWQPMKGAAEEGLDGTCYALAIRHVVGVDLVARENELRQITTAPTMPAVIRSKWMAGNRG